MTTLHWLAGWLLNHLPAGVPALLRVALWMPPTGNGNGNGWSGD